jgi:hypothetical protein
MAQTRLARCLPSTSLHCFSRFPLFPRKLHQIARQPGLISPLAKRILYSVAALCLLSKEAVILSAMYAEERFSPNLYKSVASNGRA